MRHNNDPRSAFPSNWTAGQLVADVAGRAPKHQYINSRKDN